MILSRQTDATLINGILNHPSVLPWVVGDRKPPLDATPIVANVNHVVLACEWGGFIFVRLMAGIYELHSCVLPIGRGRGTLEAGQEALDWMYEHTDAAEIVTRVPKGNIAASAAMKSLGIVPWFVTGPIWPLKGGKVPMDVYRLHLLDWITLAKDRLASLGRDFHEKLRLSGGTIDHADDPIHDVYVGAAMSMILGGQVDKGVSAYNLWAVMAGYGTISVASRAPLLIDIGTGVISPETGEFQRRLVAA